MKVIVGQIIKLLKLFFYLNQTFNVLSNDFETF